MISEPGYQVGKSKGVCSCCGGKFNDGDTCVSALEDSDSGNLIRKDFCTECWHADDSDFFSFWQTRLRMENKRQAADSNAILSCFQGMNDGKDQRSSELKYVIALYLVREKVLRLVDIMEDAEGEKLVLEGPEKLQMSCVRNPGISDQKIEELTTAVNALFFDNNARVI